LAAALLQGKLSFPSVVFLDENVQLLQTVPGYNPPRRFDYIMRYFGNDAYKNTEWEQFQNTYDSPIKESAGKTN
jgi:thioredoxin-related protein